jgi:uncharacterized protein (TIGR04222 family)
MEDTWGIPGPEFLALYLTAFLVSLLFVFAVRILTRSGAAHSTAAPVALSTHQVACLTGGPRRVVEAAVARLVDTGQLRPSRAGYVQVGRHIEATNPVERTVLADAQRYGRRSTAILTDRLAGSDAVQEVVTSLVRVGYYVDDRTTSRRQVISLVPMAVVLAVGLVRWFAGMANDRPIGYLTLMLIGTALALHVLRRMPIDQRTFQGAQAVQAVEVGDSPAECVATGGFAGHPDEAVRASLATVQGRPRGNVRSVDRTTGPWLLRTRSSGASCGAYGAGTYSSGGGGGSGCGGGSCGG